MQSCFIDFFLYFFMIFFFIYFFIFHMKGRITKIFETDPVTKTVEIIEVAKDIEIDASWNVIDRNKNWYTRVPGVWKVAKVDLVSASKIVPRTANAEDFPDTAFMQHTAKWANAMLRNIHGGIREALFEVISE